MSSFHRPLRVQRSATGALASTSGAPPTAARYAAVPATAAAAVPRDAPDALAAEPRMSAASKRSMEASHARSRQDLAHYLHDCSGMAPRERTAGLTMFGAFLEQAKSDLETNGRTQMCLDTAVIDSYLRCEDEQITCARPSPASATVVPMQPLRSSACGSGRFEPAVVSTVQACLAHSSSCVCDRTGTSSGRV